MKSATSQQGHKNALTAFEQSRLEKKVTERPELLFSFEELNELMDLQSINELEKRFAGAA
jgi:hypothetical protein